jgi:hypothetical protein
MISKIVNQILSCKTSFEDYFGIKEIILNDLEFNPKSGIKISDLTFRECLQNDLKVNLSIIAVMFDRCKSKLPCGGHFLFLNKSPKLLVSFTVQIQKLVLQRCETNGLPFELKSEVLAVSNLYDLIDCLDEIDILLRASSDFDVLFALKVAVFKSSSKLTEKRSWGAKYNHTPTVNSLFRKKCQCVCNNKGRGFAGMVLVAMAEIVTGTCQRKGHALKPSKGNQKPIRRNGDKAWRHKVGENGMRILYWICPGEKVEFASVGEHDDFKIPR